MAIETSKETYLPSLALLDFFACFPIRLGGLMNLYINLKIRNNTRYTTIKYFKGRILNFVITKPKNISTAA
ncbi:hypothetical protein [Sharpea azabuensis]|uniref:hypothetical protein n=1 Tax=Sharpea azabuensis TaxID=322505 RepID=UPI0015691099|nr:hypothetical protein [Sharpea azabuensis]